MTTAIVKVEQQPLAVQEAAQIRREIELELQEVLRQENLLGHRYVRVGMLLLKFKTGEYWRQLNYAGMDHFIQEMTERFRRGRTQLYDYLGVVESLLPDTDEKFLEDIGISKARTLKQAKRAAGGKQLPAAVLESAANPEVTANQLRTVAHEAYNVPEPNTPKGTWIDLGFYATHDEREVLKRAFRTAERTDPVIPKDLPDHMRRRESVLRWAIEYLSSFEAAANRGEA